MNVKTAIAWFEEVVAKPIRKNRQEGVTNFVTGAAIYEYDETEAVAWVTEAETAIKTTFPAGHPLTVRWNSIFANADGKSHLLSSDGNVDAARAVFQTALNLLRSGRLKSLVDGIRAETADELLEQADLLLKANYTVASAVLAGGALETVLHYLCVSNNVSWQGDGSISKYEQALGKERNSGREIISVTDGKLVTAWGGIRNDAAHQPAQFTRSSADVRAMIDGIRQFIARVQAQ